MRLVPSFSLFKQSDRSERSEQPAQLQGYRRFVRFMAAVAASLALIAAIAASPTVAAQSVSEAYVAGEGTQAGMIIQLDEADQGRVKPATQANVQAIHGVVVLPNDAPIALSDATNERQVYVATSGTYKILVSDQNGPVAKNDYIAVSSIDGVGMNADPLPNVIAGKALTSFDGTTDVKSRTEVVDSKGQKRTISFGYVMADINITRNPLVQNTAPNLPSFLQKATEGIADKPVSPLRAYLSVVIAVITMVIVVVVLSSGVRSSLVAIGRNPLARQSITRKLLQIVLIGLTILIVGLFGVYLILKL